MVLFGSMQAVSNVAPPVELERSRAVAIMRRTDPKLACETVEALLAGGMQAIEVTFNSPGALDMLRAIDQALGKALDQKEAPDDAFRKAMAVPLKQLKDAVAVMKRQAPDARATKDALVLAEKYGVK